MLASQVQNVSHFDRCPGLSTVGHFPASRLSAFAYLTQKLLSQAVVQSFATIVLVRYEESVQYIISEVNIGIVSSDMPAALLAPLANVYSLLQEAIPVIFLL